MRPSPSTPSSAARDSDREAHPARRIIARAPTRIDFGGGWTDVPPYPERDGGFVCNVAVSLTARVELVAEPAELSEGSGRPGSTGAGEPRDPLAAAALRHAGVAARVRISGDFPVGAGLGGSSAAGVALQAALQVLAGEPLDPRTLAGRSRAVEVEELGIAGGWQDHYASAYGGALGLDFGTSTTVDRIALSPDTAQALARRCLLLYSGETRISGANITAVLEAYRARTPRVTQALTRMASLARQMTTTLRSGDLDALGPMVAEHWEYQRSLHPAITTPRIEEIVQRARAAGALGAKALGASGGGCVVIVTPEDPSAVHAAVGGLGTMLPYAVEPRGANAEWAA